MSRQIKKMKMPKTNETVLEINLQSLEHNYQYLRSKINTSTKLLSVVKAFAYGSDAVAIAQKLEYLGVDYFAVAYTTEGVSLREAGIKTPILVLHPQVVNFETLIKYQLEPSIYSKKVLNDFLAIAKRQKTKKYPIHLKFNTGLNRLGFIERDIDYITTYIKEKETVKVTSVFSHLAASEDTSEKEFTLNQIDAFKRITNTLDAKLAYIPFKHLLNTSGIINYANIAQFDMVRTGIGLYGFGNEAKIDAKLKPIATLKTIISQIHTIAPNESVGYNRAFSARKPTQTATLPIGHADGIRRQYGNGKSYVFLNGEKALIIGNVCMDMIMIDVTHINCKEGDEVIIFGENHSAEQLANSAKTISYELLTGISQRVKRTFI